ncbi:hypothetical protein FHX10_004542 [Rhizobium sp. BK591]|uniref:hypothetical protein n=1 Tax=Rhizobium sp. BK591 TaxID=2586985 RepID=UPI001615B1F4|nr:hypothetical protein [Rhizobium sp. BK591]MBB3745005.1 hypothetical protein [Rhizobium sp. BK591]
MYARRWGDHDRHFGPFLFARDRRYKHLALLISSGSVDDDEDGCFLRFSCYGFTVIVSLPQIIRPHSEWVDLSDRDWATPRQDGRKGYTQTDERVFGLSYSEGFLQFKLGRSTGDSTTDRTKGYFLPWTQWRYVRKSWFGLDGEHLRTDWESSDMETRRNAWQVQREFEDAMPKAVFAFKDFDGEELTATTHLEEMEWRFGTGCFKWLSLFRRRRIRRSLDIQFSGETGRRKGSWKGGTVGHAIEMKKTELHEAAFRRYCSENKMTFVGVA